MTQAPALSERAAPVRSDGARRRRADRAGAIAVAAPVLALVAVATVRWSRGWLLLLDTSPGPRSAAWSGPDLPVGVGLRTIVGLVAAVDPQWVGWVVPTAALVVGNVGAVRLAQRWRGPDGERLALLPAAVAGCVAVANPFVATRFAAGQIGVLWGYATVWWLITAAIDAAESDDRRSWIALGAWLAVCGSTTIHLALIGVVPIVLAGFLHARRIPRRRAAARALLALAVGATLTAAWLVPALAANPIDLDDAGGAAAATAFSSGGPALTLWARALGGAAFWRASPAGALTGVGLVVAAAWAATLVAWRHGNGHSRDLRHLLVAGAAAGAAATYAGRWPFADVWAWCVAELWPAGLLREPGKLAMLCLPAPACGAAVAMGRVEARRRGVAIAVVAATILLTVGAWTAFTTTLESSEYPDDWVSARSVADADDCPIVVLGDGAYVNPGFTGDRVVAHPARGFLGPRSIVSDDSQVPGLPTRAPSTPAETWAVAVNDRYLHDAGQAPDATDATAAGVGWIFVDRPVDRPELGLDLLAGGFALAHHSDRVDLWRAPGGCA